MLNDSKNPLRKLITLSSVQYLNSMLELRDQLLPPLLENDEEKLLSSCLVMRIVSPTDWTRHCPVKLICNHVPKACTIMPLCKAVKLKLLWQLSSGCGSSRAGREGCAGPHAQHCMTNHEKFSHSHQGTISFSRLTSTKKAHHPYKFTA